MPRPRLHLIHFHGVLAPNAKLRSKIVPSPAERATETSSEDAHGQGAPARMSWPRLLKRVFDSHRKCRLKILSIAIPYFASEMKSLYGSITTSAVISLS